MTSWVTGPDGRNRDGSDGRQRGPGTLFFGDQYGSLPDISTVGPVTPDGDGVSGLSDGAYVVGELLPVGAVPDYTIAVLVTLPAATGTDQTIIGRADASAGGVELVFNGAGNFEASGYETDGDTVYSQTLALSGLSPGDDVWLVFQPGTDVGSTDTRTNMAWVEDGTRNSSVSGSNAHARIHDLDVPYLVGRAESAGTPFNGAVKAIVTWASKLTESQLQDVADGTSAHSPVSGFMEGA